MLSKLYILFKTDATPRVEPDRNSYDTGTPEQLKFICVTTAQADFLKQFCANAITELEEDIKYNKEIASAYYDVSDKQHQGATRSFFERLNYYKDLVRKLQRKHKLLAGIQKQVKLS